MTITKNTVSRVIGKPIWYFTILSIHEVLFIEFDTRYAKLRIGHAFFLKFGNQTKSSLMELIENNILEWTVNEYV